MRTTNSEASNIQPEIEPFSLAFTMTYAMDNLSAFELFCNSWDFPSNDKSTVMPTPSVSPETLVKPPRAEIKVQNLELHLSQGPTPLPHLPCPGPSTFPKENYAVSNRQYASPSSSPESVRQQKVVTSSPNKKRKTTDIDNKHDDVDTEEHDRLNKHRAVNRKTAAKARKRAKVDTAAWEKSFAEESARNPILKRTIVSLHEELYNLQMQALGHVDCNCAEIQAYNRKRARKISQCWELGQSD
ncbi:hypothetical protein KCV07_g8196, partial [Aureobasidium melanogenum]